MQQIEDTIVQQNAQVLIVGYPINMDGTIGPKAKEVDLFIEELIKRFNLPVERVDERLSSHTVLQGFKEEKTKPRRKSGEIDSRAAALILQDFIEAQLFKTNPKW